RPWVEVPAVVAEVHPGEDDLRVAGAHEPLDLGDDGLDWLAPAPAPGVGHDAEAAAMLAAVLDLDERAGVSGGESPDRDHGIRPPSEHVAHADQRANAFARLVEEAWQRVTIPGPEDQIDAGDGRDRLGIGLGVAAGDHDHRTWVPRDR